MPFHDDPLLLRWALDVAVDTVFVSPSARQRVLDTILPEAAFGELVDRLDGDELASLIRHLRAERWAAHADLLAERWPEWNGSLAQAAARLTVNQHLAGADGSFLICLDLPKRSIRCNCAIRRRNPGSRGCGPRGRHRSYRGEGHQG